VIVIFAAFDRISRTKHALGSPASTDSELPRETVTITRSILQLDKCRRGVTNRSKKGDSLKSLVCNICQFGRLVDVLSTISD